VSRVETTRFADAGTGRLEFVWNRSRTVLHQALATSPLKILNPQAGRTTSWIYLATYGGGLVGGDAVDVNVDVRARARAVITTQSSTKVYRSVKPVSQRLTARVSDHALLVFAPDPTICFAGSTLQQTQYYDVSPSGNLVVLDWLMCGRHARGERWAFDGYSSCLELWRGTRRVLYDATILRSDEGPLADRMGRFNVWGTLVMVGPLVREAAATIVSNVQRLPIEPCGALIVSASPLGPDGVLLRVAGESVERTRSTVRIHMDFLRSHLGDEVWARKW
jgi:urease accessory protein